MIDFLTDPERFGRLGARVPKGILLYGPPGTGKTLLAKAIASEAGAQFYAQSASAFVEMFAGLGAARIRKLFEEARKNAPSIVFIDELDAVGAQRTGHGFSREQDQTLNQLLVELDGFASRDQVIVMGASNRLQDLDAALLRPGRFDRQVLVAAPDLAGREEILHVHVRGKPLATGVNLRSIARQTAGLTGAELENIANEAAIIAGRSSQTAIRQSDFEDAMERVVAGLQQRKVMTEKERRILAYHEAGHAVMSHLTGDLLPVHKVTIVSRGQALGYTLNLPSEERYLHTAEEFADLLKVYLARPRGRADRLRARHERRRQRPREGDRGRARDGLRVRHVERDRLAHDARRQLRALRGDEAAARPGAGAAHRRGVRGGDSPAAEAPPRARPDREGAAGEGDARQGRARRAGRRGRARVALLGDDGHGSRCRAVARRRRRVTR